MRNRRHTYIAFNNSKIPFMHKKHVYKYETQLYSWKINISLTNFLVARFFLFDKSLLKTCKNLIIYCQPPQSFQKQINPLLLFAIKPDKWRKFPADNSGIRIVCASTAHNTNQPLFNCPLL